MLLHNDKELFQEVIASTASELQIALPIVEKDYYVTMILKMLSERCPECVFKGGTSLSKCHHVINRFSEDIDITFSDKLTQGMRKKLKNQTILGISQELNMSITDFDKARSRRDYNCYTFAYDAIDKYNVQSQLIPGVKMEVALGAVSFPTEKLLVDSYAYQFLKKNNADIVEEYQLEPFMMNVQSIDRTLIDKIFAIGDYYLQGTTKRHSRHIYDIYMLLPRVTLDGKFKMLIKEVRELRANMSICPSAAEGISISDLLDEIIEKEVYKKDYIEITSYFQNHPVPYNEIIEALKTISNTKIFEEN